jgi:predicted TIM-barrel fold metal-dependent hydrolase
VDRVRQPGCHGAVAVVVPNARHIIDAHHHLWDLSACRYPWLEETGVVRFFGDPAPIQRNYLADELRQDASDYRLDASVHVQVGVASGDEVKESEWLNQAAGGSGLPTALVAFCDLVAENAQQVLDQQQAIGRVRGIRHIVGRSSAEDANTGSDSLLDNQAWIENLSSLRERDLSFDLQLIPQQVDKVAAVLETIPGLRVALCHCGSPWDQSPSGLESWRTGLQRLARNPDVYCKISGLSMFNHDWSVDDLRPIIDSCIEIFGADRCMFGSNYPVDKLHKTWSEIWGAYECITASSSATEQARMFAGTAAEFYTIS